MDGFSVDFQRTNNFNKSELRTAALRTLQTFQSPFRLLLLIFYQVLFKTRMISIKTLHQFIHSCEFEYIAAENSFSKPTQHLSPQFWCNFNSEHCNTQSQQTRDHDKTSFKMSQCQNLGTNLFWLCLKVFHRWKIQNVRQNACFVQLRNFQGDDVLQIHLHDETKP
jgi:hypothetical protein